MMKKVISMMAVALMMVSFSGVAQQKPTPAKKAGTTKMCTPAEMKACKKGNSICTPEQRKKCAKNNKTCTAAEMKNCPKEKKAGCCMGKGKS